MANTESNQIVPYYAQPHVYTVIRNNSQYDETVADRTTAELPFSTVIVTGADMGVNDVFVKLTSYEQKVKLFGKSNFKKYGQPSIQADALFNGNTNVWFCRAMPDNARYANIIFLAKFRKGKVLNELGQETGLYRMEIKFDKAYATKPVVVDGALSKDVIEEYARSLTSMKADAQTGYMTVPICYARIAGKGRYGNNYSMSIVRDSESEKDYDLKMYKFNLYNNETVTALAGVHTGSLFQTTRYNTSTLINDVMDQYNVGDLAVDIRSFEDSFETLYNFYKDIVRENRKYLSSSRASESDMEDLNVAQSITEDSFDPIFGLRLNTRTDEHIPYYQNYSVKSSGSYVAPDLEIPNTAGATKPLNIANWSNAYAGARVLVVADPLHAGARWMYNVITVNHDTGDIIYDEGEETAIDDDQFDGIDISLGVGHLMEGGHDGDFESITVGGETRTPTDAEMKILLAREYVKIFRGQKDRRILSPARINLDFIFDANYNMTASDVIGSIDSSVNPIFSSSTVLTDKDATQLSVLASTDSAISITDLNVKKAIFDLNEFRNRNGMTVVKEAGAGCSVYFDMNLTNIKSMNINYELKSLIDMMKGFTGKCTSIDLGYYDIFDPVSRKRVSVTVTYFIAKNLVPHIIREGLNKPFTYNYAQINAIQKDDSLVASGEMIRNSFKPEFDLIDWDVKEELYKARINYWTTSDEGRKIQRAVQNTRELDASALLEESNVRVLNTLKKNLEKACQGYLYQWNEPEVRKGFENAQMEIYRPWIGTLVKNLEIKFTANEWEQQRMIMHCYVAVEFRDIIKRIILEININRANYSSTTSGGDQ